MGPACMFLLLSTILLPIGYNAEQFCRPQETLQLGTIGVLDCSFPKEYFGIYWYDTQDLTKQPFVFIQEGQKRGHGYESGEYDLYTNGSLLIYRVTIDHERIFTAVLFETRISNLVPNEVDVDVFARPHIPFPVIDKCVNKQHCYQQVGWNDTMECSVADVRPPVQLAWVKRTSDGDLEENFQLKYFPKGGLNTTTATLKFQKRASLHFYLFVCKAESAISILDYSDSFLLVEVYITLMREQENIFLQEAKNGSVITLPCDVQDDTIFIVWKKKINGTRYDVIAYGYIKTGTFFPENPYILNHDGALVIPQINQSQENVYVCYVSNGIEEHVESYNVTIENVIEEFDQNKKSSGAIVITICLVLLCVIVGMAFVYIVFRKRRNITKSKDQTENTLPPNVMRKEMGTSSEKEPLSDSKQELQTESETYTSPGKEPLDDTNPQTQTESDNLNHQDENQSNKQHEHPEHGEIQDHQNNIQIKKYVVGSEKPDREEKIIFLIHGSNIEIDAIAFTLLKYVTGVKNKDHFSCDVKCLDNNQTLQSCGIEMQIYTLKDKLSSKFPFDITFVIIPVLMSGSVGTRSTAFATDTTSIGDIKDSNDTPVTVATTGSSDATMQGKITFVTDAASAIDFKEITEQLHTLTTCEDTYKLEYVNAVVILQDITQELSLTLEDCLHHPVFKILGKNLRDKVIAMTACNTKGEFEALKMKGNIEYPSHVYFSLKNRSFKSNSSEVVFCGEQSESKFKNFIEKLKNESHVSLEKSMQVVSKRKDLVNALSTIEKSMELRRKICKEKTEEKRLINTSGIKVSIEHGEMALNCAKCKDTCSYPVASKTWSYFSYSCDVCKCDTQSHHECTYRFKTEDEIEKEMRDKEFSLQLQVRTKAEEIDRCLDFLNEFALKPTVLSIGGNAQNITITENTSKGSDSDNFLTNFNNIFE